MKQASSSRYLSLIASIALINTLTVCAAGQGLPDSSPAPAPTALPGGLPSPDPRQEPGTTPEAVPVPGALPAATSVPGALPAATSVQTTTPPANRAGLRLPDTAVAAAPAQPSQRIAEGTRRILALRRLLQLGFNTSECSRALRLLERLRDVKTAPPADPEKAIEEEYRVLLAARPGDPLPPSSAVKIMDASRFYREEQTKIWTDMAREIGAERAEGLRNLIGQGNTSPFTSNKLRVMETFPGTFDAPSGTGPVPSLKGDRNKKRSRTSNLDNPKATPTLTAPTSAPTPIIVPPPVSPGEDQPAVAAPDASNSPVSADSDPLVQPPQPKPNTNGLRPLPGRQADSARDVSEALNYTFVMYSPTTVRLSLDEMIDLLRAKIKAMIGNSSGFSIGKSF